jgi:hypothetical protein
MGNRTDPERTSMSQVGPAFSQILLRVVGSVARTIFPL